MAYFETAQPENAVSQFLVIYLDYLQEATDVKFHCWHSVSIKFRKWSVGKNGQNNGLKTMMLILLQP